MNRKYCRPILATNYCECFELIDMGLPSGTLWADRNLGADSITGNVNGFSAGNYYAWGETEPRDDDWAKNKPYNYVNCPFNNGKSEFDRAYFWNNKDKWLDGIVLKPEYDAVVQCLGKEGCCIPTAEDCQEFIDNTTSALTYDYKGSGVDGVLFTSKANGNEVFIPFSGRRDESDTVRTDAVILWSSTWNANDTWAYCSMALYSRAKDESQSETEDACEVRPMPRPNGVCIRAVLKKQ